MNHGPLNHGPLDQRAGTRGRVRVVIVNYNGGDDTLACIDSVLASDWPAQDLEVVLVDNASADGVAAKVKTGFPRVTLIESGRNLGFAGGCNLGPRDPSGADYVALVNNDATVEPGWLSPLTVPWRPTRASARPAPRSCSRDPFVGLDVASPTGYALRRRPQAPGRATQRRPARRRVRPRAVAAVDGFWGMEHGTGSEASFQWSRVPPTCGYRCATTAPCRRASCAWPPTGTGW